ncbi:hypothetical protein RF11_13470 [Thelohanellus kitauei]|uniref:Uncharacterized protein n=1 Tax=Thelohanellus kitauei TaxID=669202 RepID=A0A0C2MRV0_THEKT|nr:hypothetical protein RF11_13470 [Thelohanellus kitauei]
MAKPKQKIIDSKFVSVWESTDRKLTFHFLMNKIENYYAIQEIGADVTIYGKPGSASKTSNYEPQKVSHNFSNPEPHYLSQEETNCSHEPQLIVAWVFDQMDCYSKIQLTELKFEFLKAKACKCSHNVNMNYIDRL